MPAFHTLLRYSFLGRDMVTRKDSWEEMAFKIWAKGQSKADLRIMGGLEYGRKRMEVRN